MGRANSLHFQIQLIPGVQKLSILVNTNSLGNVLPVPAPGGTRVNPLCASSLGHPVPTAYLSIVQAE